MANTWTVNADGSVDLNGTLQVNPYYSKLAVQWNDNPTLIEAYLEVEIPNTQEVNLIAAALAVVPNLPSLPELTIYEPRLLLTSQPGDTINVAGLSILQTSSRPDKLGV